MSLYELIIYFTLVGSVLCGTTSKQNVSPPHCTIVSKDTDYPSKFKFDYPVAYLIPGQQVAFQQMFCLHPPTVRKAYTQVCDWSAPPQVQFTLGDEYVHVVRQDPTGRYLGNAVITTYQWCGHNYTTDDVMLATNDVSPSPVVLTEFD